MKEQIRFVLLVVGALAALVLGREVYRWYAFQEERRALVGLREEVVDAGAEIIRSRVRLDTVTQRMDSVSAVVRQHEVTLRRYRRYVRDGMLPTDIYADYEQDRVRFEAAARERDAWQRRFAELAGRERGAVRRYNVLADSMRVLADRIGEPYLRIPAPIEAAAERGVIQVPD